MNVETVLIESVTLDSSNVHKHSTKNIEAIKGSLARFGQRTPIVIDAAGVVYKGNGTLLAARSLGWTEIQVVRYADMTPAELTAYAIADNATQSQDYDDLALAKTLESIKHTDETLFAATGYDDGQFDKLIEGIGNQEMIQKAIGDVASEDGRTDMNTGQTVRIVVKVADLAFVERVLASTGKDVKGEALQVVCEAYAKSHGG